MLDKGVILLLVDLMALTSEIMQWVPYCYDRIEFSAVLALKAGVMEWDQPNGDTKPDIQLYVGDL